MIDFAKMDMTTKTLWNTCSNCKKKFEYQSLVLLEYTPAYCEACMQKVINEDKQKAKAAYIAELADRAGIARTYRIWDNETGFKLGSNWILSRAKNAIKRSIWEGGDNGLGKTHALCFAMYCELYHKYTKMMYVLCDEWLDTMMSLKTSDEREDQAKYKSELKRAKEVELLFLDDISKREDGYSSAKSELLFRVIDCRDREKLPIWITSNHSGDEFKKRLGTMGKTIMVRIERMLGNNIKI